MKANNPCPMLCNGRLYFFKPVVRVNSQNLVAINKYLITLRIMQLLCTYKSFSTHSEDYQQPASEPSQFCYPARPLPGVKDYYYSICKGHQGKHINKNKAASYSSYLTSPNFLQACIAHLRIIRSSKMTI